ncbi:MAG: hypothetical protein LBM96_08930 [Methanobrevibacter sp.]|jgi:glucose uptake protein GlcU|nr:hypothetical protein [Candidatus Methanoflexus mossambicus]
MATSGTLFFSHIIPVILGLIGILFLGNGIMQDEKKLTIIGIVLFLIGCFVPYIILPFLIR